MSHRVSVIVTNYNYAQFLPECLASIRAQVFRDFELIVVDDCSEDGSVRIAKKYAPDKLLVLGNNHGTSAASNLGVNIASGEYSVFINADDTICPDFLSECVLALDKADAGTALAYTDYWHFGHGKDGKPISNSVHFQPWNVEVLKKYNYVLCSAMFRTSVFLDVGGFTVDFGMEDYELWLKMALKGHKGVHIPRPLYNYRAHESNRTHYLDIHSACVKIKEQLGIPTVVELEPAKPVQKTFSLCYASRRFWALKAVVSEWFQKAKNADQVECVVCVDSDDAPSLEVIESAEFKAFKDVKVVVQDSTPFNCVKAWNLAATKATGKCLILISDDFVPQPDWDESLLSIQPPWIDDDKIVRVNDCNSAFMDKPLTLPILTKKRYDRLGYVFWPEYESMFCDREMLDQARAEGAVVDAPEILFEHVHPSCFKRSKDDVDRAHSSEDRWERGKAIYTRRKLANFPNTPRVPDEEVQPIVSTRSIPDLWKKYLEVRGIYYSISLEGALWLQKFVEDLEPYNILDIGSNFSAVVFGLYGQTKESINLWVTDVESADLTKHRAFVKNNGVYPGLGGKLNDMRGVFDVVFVDAALADSKERFDIIMHATKLVDEKGVMILDDGHFINVQSAVRELTAGGWKANVERATLDRFDRYFFTLRRA